MRVQQGSNGSDALAARSGQRHTPIRQSAGNVQAIRLRVLAVLDGSERSEAVIDYLQQLAQRGARLEVVLLNIQPRPSAWQTRGVPEGSPRERLGSYRGKRVVHSVRQRLDSAGITATERVEVGDEALTIIRCAAEISADQIVMPVSPVGPARRWMARLIRMLIANVATEVAQLSPVPVVMVNRRAADVAH